MDSPTIYFVVFPKNFLQLKIPVSLILYSVVTYSLQLGNRLPVLSLYYLLKYLVFFNVRFTDVHQYGFSLFG